MRVGTYINQNIIMIGNRHIMYSDESWENMLFNLMLSMKIVIIHHYNINIQNKIGMYIMAVAYVIFTKNNLSKKIFM